MPATQPAPTEIPHIDAAAIAQITDLSRFKLGNWAEIQTRLHNEIQELLYEMPTLRSAHSRQLCHLRIVACSEAIRDGNYDQP